MLRRLRSGAVVLCYHDVCVVRNVAGDQALHLERDDFEGHMEWLASRFTTVSLSEVMQRWRSGRSLRGLAAVTFDDGYIGVLRHALPVLQRLKVPSTIFVTTNAPDSSHLFWWDWPVPGANASDIPLRRRLLHELQGDGARIARALDVNAAPINQEIRAATWAELAAVEGPLVEFGAHSVTHRSLVTLPDDALAYELRDSARVLEERLGLRPRTFAYPYGLWDPRVASAAASAGYSGAFTLDGGIVGPHSDLMSLPRLNIPASISQPAFETWVSWMGRWRT